ncbi:MULTISPECIES: hypothetical protein [Rhizobium]|uniref:Transmembrane protein n=1 Tax=Rhizobium favelukesii TaxID=348824 RepID=W6REL4_9HYPH|nr:MULTISPECIES: hypothetical protein [Rhizobium]MCA0803319.1 hypothetical protein [Rhizobium sp. T1473]MCS0458957.1 hypothetical protein [Rhizobium favelukesii]UFS83081.1 hypothetical protein LPB79_12560 [Rhizobium sp. T136]CDM59299.1 hypothetical protein LPU83_3656 [Rhizobium favelukesii]
MRFLTVVTTGLALIAPAAHLFVLRNKIGLPKADDFVAQQIYRDWWIVGPFLPLAWLAISGTP